MTPKELDIRPATCVVCGKPFTPTPDQRRPICSEKCKAELTHV